VQPQFVSSDLLNVGRQVLLETALVVVNGDDVLDRINNRQIFEIEFDDSRSIFEMARVSSMRRAIIRVWEMISWRTDPNFLPFFQAHPREFRRSLR